MLHPLYNKCYISCLIISPLVQKLRLDDPARDGRMAPALDLEDPEDLEFDGGLEVGGGDAVVAGVVTRWTPKTESPYELSRVALGALRTTLDLEGPVIRGWVLQNPRLQNPASAQHVTVGRFLDAVTHWQARHAITDKACGRLFALLRWTLQDEAYIPTIRQVTYLVDQVMGNSLEIYDACPGGDCVVFRDSEFTGGEQNGDLDRCPRCATWRYRGEDGGRSQGDM